MKICITSQGNNLEAEVDPRFGRCSYFIIADPETLEFEAVSNINAQAGGGAGIQSGQLMSEQGVKAVLTGNVGPNAFQALKAAEIDIITGVSGKVMDAINKYIKGDYKPISSATVESHFGMKGGR
ncbi:MAG: NifB/NifX family molybdenum-iron cluster-binding protein [Spirochaetales bacterium]|nr:NifB/NifX family molybdenum-iron cluster-binding protein [Spirochaetales bacterium]